MRRAQRPSSRWRRAARLVGLALALSCIVVLAQAWRALGTSPDPERMKRSPQWDDGVFVNPQPLWNDMLGMLPEMASPSPDAAPHDPLPVVTVAASRFAVAPSSGLRVTWLGHSTMLVEIDGHTVLTDPVWGERTSPLTWVGPERWYPPLLGLSELPPLTAVVISHDHYDHLDYPTIRALRDHDTTFVVPLGVAAHLVYWGVPASRIVELDWWERTTVAGLQIVCTPARHASGRTLLDKDTTLWAGYALVGPQHRVYFSGDTGLFDDLTEIGTRLGPFDLTMIEVGAYGQAWPDWHLGPEQAVSAHRRVRGRVLLPVHWGLFNLAMHGWTEPIERVLAAASDVDARVATPRPGESFEPSAVEASVQTPRWWPELPWRTAETYPIIATADGSR